MLIMMQWIISLRGYKRFCMATYELDYFLSLTESTTYFLYHFVQQRVQKW
jgi:hypothetical protein